MVGGFGKNGRIGNGGGIWKFYFNLVFGHYHWYGSLSRNMIICNISKSGGTIWKKMRVGKSEQLILKYFMKNAASRNLQKN